MVDGWVEETSAQKLRGLIPFAPPPPRLMGLHHRLSFLLVRMGAGGTASKCQFIFPAAVEVGTCGQAATVHVSCAAERNLRPSSSPSPSHGVWAAMAMGRDDARAANCVGYFSSEAPLEVLKDSTEALLGFPPPRRSLYGPTSWPLFGSSGSRRRVSLIYHQGLIILFFIFCSALGY